MKRIIKSSSNVKYAEWVCVDDDQVALVYVELDAGDIDADNLGDTGVLVSFDGDDYICYEMNGSEWVTDYDEIGMYKDLFKALKHAESVMKDKGYVVLFESRQKALINAGFIYEPVVCSKSIKSSTNRDSRIDQLKSLIGTDVYVKLGKDYQMPGVDRWYKIYDVDEDADEIRYRGFIWLGPDGWLPDETGSIIDLKSFLDSTDDPMVTMDKKDIEKTKYEGTVHASSDIDIARDYKALDNAIQEEARVLKGYMDGGATLTQAIRYEKGYYNDLVLRASEVIKDKYPEGIHDF